MSEEIDKYNILEATKISMCRAVKKTKAKTLHNLLLMAN